MGKRGPIEYYCAAAPSQMPTDRVTADIVGFFSTHSCLFSVTDIALWYAISKRGARKRIARLEKAGIVRRWVSPEDFDAHWAGRSEGAISADLLPSP